MRATWYCVDIECSGPIPGLYDMISLGAVPIHGTTATGLSLGAKFYVEICPTGPKVDAGAMAVNGLDIADLRANGVALRLALQRLSGFVEATLDGGATPVFVGHNAPFDWSFVNHAYVSEELTNPFGYKALDTKALAMGVLGLHWLDANKEILEEVLDLPAQDPVLTHRADYDAWYQAHILKALLERAPACAAS